jgi:hypothetical protein
MTDPVRSAAGGRLGRDRGQAAVLLIMIVAVLAAATMSGIGRLGANVRDRVHAQSIADAAALAALGGGRGQAAALSAAQGATLVSWSNGPGPGEVTVVVRVGSESATARASDAPIPGLWPLTGP